MKAYDAGISHFSGFIVLHTEYSEFTLTREQKG